jgi:glycosyltransferase involved in cell wall biosynthesis
MLQPPFRPRIAVVTPLFPIRGEVYRGRPIYLTVREMAAGAEIGVFCPMAVYPPLRALQPRHFVYRRADMSWKPEGIPHLRYLEYPALPLAGRLTNGWFSYRAVLEPLRRFRPDVILAYWLYPEGWGTVRAGQRLGVPVVVGARGSDLLRIADAWTLRMTRRVLAGAAAVAVVSGEMGRRAADLGADPAKVRVIPNGCDTGVFHPADRRAAREALSIPPGSRLVLFVGHLTAAKGALDLVAAFRRMARDGDRLVLVGEGALRDELSAAATLDPSLTLAGAAPPEQVARWLAACDLLALPSYSEGCPNVVLEALACGRPVVASRVGASPDLVTPQCGILVPPGGIEALAAALTAALDRVWDPAEIAASHRRPWSAAAKETLELCLDQIGATVRHSPPRPPGGGV